MNRETWLNLVTDQLRPAFIERGHPLPAIRISCGFTSSKRAIGECHYPGGSLDGTTEIFIHPGQAAALEVAAILLHELCHAALGQGFGHGPVFGKLARGFGLHGKLTATYAGPQAAIILSAAIQKVGPYPHATLLSGQVADKPKRQRTFRQKNLVCPSCGFYAKVLEEQMSWGRLTCPVDGEMLLTSEERKGG